MLKYLKTNFYQLALKKAHWVNQQDNGEDIINLQAGGLANFFGKDPR